MNWRGKGWQWVLLLGAWGVLSRVGYQSNDSSHSTVACRSTVDATMNNQCLVVLLLIALVDSLVLLPPWICGLPVQTAPVREPCVINCD